MFKTETHAHTSEGSACGRMTAEELVRAYYAAGFKTLFISNHFTAKHIAAWGELNWEETIDRFLLGYRNAKLVGDELGMHVLPAAEIGFDATPELHYLVYGISEAFLKAHPGLTAMDQEAFYEIANENGILMIQAHPYRDGNTHVTPRTVDGFEVCNPNPRHNNYSHLAEETAAQYRLYRTAGSDAHRPEDVGQTAMVSAQEIRTAEDYIRLVKSGTAVFGG